MVRIWISNYYIFFGNKLNYKNFNETNGFKKSEIKINLQNKMNNANEQRNSRNSRDSASKKENKISSKITN